MLDELTITVSAFSRATRRRRIRRTIITLVSFLVLLTVGTGATYSAFLNHPERSRIRQVALLPAPDAILTPGETVPTQEAAAAARAEHPPDRVGHPGRRGERTLRRHRLGAHQR